MKALNRIAVVAVSAGVALACAVSPATADGAVYKVGTKGCSANQLGQTVAYTIGITEHYPPPTGYGYFSNTGRWRVTKKLASKTRGGDWTIVSWLQMSNSGTYATCVASGTP